MPESFLWPPDPCPALRPSHTPGSPRSKHMSSTHCDTCTKARPACRPYLSHPTCLENFHVNICMAATFSSFMAPHSRRRLRPVSLAGSLTLLTIPIHPLFHGTYHYRVIGPAQIQKMGTAQSHEFWEVWFIEGHLWRMATMGNTNVKKIRKVSRELRQTKGANS